MRTGFSVPAEIKLKDAYDVVIVGLEGGHYSSLGVVDGATWEPAWRAAEKGEENAFAKVTLYDSDAHKEGIEAAGEQIALTDEAIQRGFDILAEKAPHLLAHILADNYDVIDGDALMQCVVFGAVVYG